MISSSGAADWNWLVIWPTSSVGRNNSPFLSKNSPPPSRWTESKSLRLLDNFSVSAVAAAFANSGVGASTTARISRSWSNALSKAISRCRQSRLGEISRLMSVLIPKFRAV